MLNSLAFQVARMLMHMFLKNPSYEHQGSVCLLGWSKKEMVSYRLWSFLPSLLPQVNKEMVSYRLWSFPPSLLPQVNKDSSSLKMLQKQYRGLKILKNFHTFSLWADVGLYSLKIYYRNKGDSRISEFLGPESDHGSSIAVSCGVVTDAAQILVTVARILVILGACGVGWQLYL